MTPAVRRRPSTGTPWLVIACRVLGHRWTFAADGAEMSWWCRRGCGAGGAKTYPSAAQARRYARALDRDPVADVGRRAPLLGMFPLRVGRALARRARPSGGGPEPGRNRAGDRTTGRPPDT